MVGAGTEFAVVVGWILFGMHFSQSKNALLLNLHNGGGRLTVVRDHDNSLFGLST